MISMALGTGWGEIDLINAQVSAEEVVCIYNDHINPKGTVKGD